MRERTIVGVMFEAARARLNDAIVSVISLDHVCKAPECDGECQHYRVRSLSSGVLVKVADVELVLTSAHGIWDATRRDFVAMVDVYGGERKAHTAMTVGRSILRGYVPKTMDEEGYPAPDVALLELSEHAILRRTRRPYLEHEIGYLAPATPRQVLLFAGFPGATTRFDEGEAAAPDRLAMTPVIFTAISDDSDANEPPPHFAQVRIEDELSDIDGMSGAPLVIPEGDGVLVGLVRQVVACQIDSAVQCEPAIEAVRALRHPHGVAAHQNAALGRAADEILERASPSRRGGSTSR